MRESVTRGKVSKMERISKEGKTGKADMRESKGREWSISSWESMVEYVKRKREERKGGGELRRDDIFKKSRLIERSPEGKGHLAGMIDKVMEELRELMREQR